MKNEFLQIRISPEFKQQVDDAASSQGQTVSQFVRDCLQVAVNLFDPAKNVSLPENTDSEIVFLGESVSVSEIVNRR